MPMPMSMLLAETGVTDPATRKKLMALASAQAGADAAATAPEGPAGPNFAAILQSNPIFQKPEDQKFSLGGAAPAGTGSALLGTAPPPQAPQPKRKRLEETAGYQEYQEINAKYKKTPWFMPAQRKDRLNQDMSRSLDLARLELVSSEGEVVDAQKWASLLEDKTRTGQQQTNWQANMAAAEDERKQRAKQEESRLALDQARLEESVRNNTSSDADRDAMRAFQERVFAANQAAAATRQVPSAQYDLGAADPASTGVFAKFAESLRKGDPLATGEDVAAAQVDASRGGGLPPMMSTPADRPRVAVDPKTKKRFYVYANGRVSPAP